MSQFKDVNVVYAYVSDWERAKKFYQETLEWPVVWSDDEIGWEEYGVEGQAHVAINKWGREEPLPAKSAVIGVLSVEDAYATTEALKAKGVKCAEVFAIPGVVTYGTFYDPDGNAWQFASSQG